MTVKLGTPACKLFAARNRELASADAAISDIVEPLLVVLNAMARQIARLTTHALDAVKVEPINRRLMTVPGVGPLTALTFRATVDQACHKPAECRAYARSSMRRHNQVPPE